MKKVRINLKRNQKSWSFTIYDSSESAFYMSDDADQIDNDTAKEYCNTITLIPGEVIEAEWLGSEYVFKDELAERGTFVKEPSREKYDKIRLGKLTAVKTMSTTRHFVELYSGWVLGNTVPWYSDDTRNDIRITPIKGKLRSKLDFSKLFQESHEKPSVEEKLKTHVISANKFDVN